MTPDERFDAKWMPEPNTGCYLWIGATQGAGYGNFYLRGRWVVAHVYAWERVNGPKPEGMDLDHVRARGCGNRRCVNPEHLELVTRRENLMRGDTVPARNAAATRCPNGHPLSGDNLKLQHRPAGNTERRCRACMRDQGAAYRDRLRTRGVCPYCGTPKVGPCRPCSAARRERERRADR